MTSASGAEQMKPHHGIRGLVKSGSGNGKSGDRRIETHGGASGSVGHIVKPGAIDSEIKPSSADSAKDAWICVRGHRITLVGRMRVDANGDVYVPDSEDEESGMVVDAGGVEMADFGAGSGAADGAQMAIVGVPTETIAIGAVGVAEDGFDVVTKGVPADAVEVASDGGATDAVKVATSVGTSEEMHPKVAARMKKLLAQMDPTFHDVFVSMFKVMVPAFFKP